MTAVTSITISKQANMGLNEQQRQVLGDVFDLIDGVTDRDKKLWRALWRAIANSTPDETFSFIINVRRDGAFHRRHLLLEDTVFKSQEQFTNFDRFRDFIKLGAGFVEWRVSKGELVPLPKSISYEECDQATMAQFHNDAVAFLRTRKAHEKLWPSVAPAIAEQGVEYILAEFGE